MSLPVSKYEYRTWCHHITSNIFFLGEHFFHCFGLASHSNFKVIKDGKSCNMPWARTTSLIKGTACCPLKTVWHVYVFQGACSMVSQNVFYNVCRMSLIVLRGSFISAVDVNIYCWCEHLEPYTPSRCLQSSNKLLLFKPRFTRKTYGGRSSTMAAPSVRNTPCWYSDLVVPFF